MAYNTSEKHHFISILKTAQKEDKIVLLSVFFLTVFFDMTIGVTVGVILACLLFVNRQANMTKGFASTHSHSNLFEDLPQLEKSFYIYRIAGSMFFGTAHRALRAISEVSNDVKIIVLDLSQVEFIDSTGLVALSSAIDSLRNKSRRIFLVAPNESLKESIQSFFRLHGQNSPIEFENQLQSVIDLVKNSR